MNTQTENILSIFKRKSHKYLSEHIKKTVMHLFCLSVIICSLCPVTVHAGETASTEGKEDGSKTVRVGWYESTFCYVDQFGRRCGIDFEYQQKISEYNGWEYEYVEGSWSNLLQMLTDGKIDLLSDVSYTEARKDVMLFPDLPMGEESYYIYIDADNRDITSDDLKTVNGKKLGVNKGSVQEGFLRDWAQRNGLAPEIVPLTCEESESMDMIARGDIDGYVTTNTFGAKEKLIPLCKVGASSFYYAVNKDRPDLLADLNRALINIQDEDPYFNQKMYEEHIYITQTNAFLTPAQEEWIRKHGTVRVGYRDNYLPFCANDKETGELTGALRDYLAHAANNLKNADINFAAVPYAGTKDAIEALKT
ncbi:MAG: transporter substrate-binding domain-containing protein [Lachnospiraceae bacterium]|nr:transporter substrate-binding domain-containing protein [Lachnospiraceae bacterium]